MSETVKRYLADLSMPGYTAGTVQTDALASDYDALAERCGKLEEVVRELAGKIDCTHVTLGENRRKCVDKALALVGEKSK